MKKGKIIIKTGKIIIKTTQYMHHQKTYVKDYVMCSLITVQ